MILCLFSCTDVTTTVMALVAKTKTTLSQPLSFGNAPTPGLYLTLKHETWVG